MTRCVQELREYYQTLANMYHQHIIKMIDETSEKKENVAAQLSEDERKIQEDNDWLIAFKDQVAEIEGN